MHNLDHLKEIFNGVGWFIPPYVSMGFLQGISLQISQKGNSFTQVDLEEALSLIYSPEYLSSMVVERYPVTPHVRDYKEIIGESVQSHFFGLDHIAVVGLMPVIEDAGKSIAKSRSVKGRDHGIFSSTLRTTVKLMPRRIKSERLVRFAQCWIRSVNLQIGICTTIPIIFSMMIRQIEMACFTATTQMRTMVAHSISYENILTEYFIERMLIRLLREKAFTKQMVFKGGYVSLRVYSSPRFTIDQSQRWRTYLALGQCGRNPFPPNFWAANY